MQNVARVILFPLALYAATIYSCYEIFWWVVIEGAPRQRENPIESAASFFRDLIGKG